MIYLLSARSTFDISLSNYVALSPCALFSSTCLDNLFSIMIKIVNTAREFFFYSNFRESSDVIFCSIYLMFFLCCSDFSLVFFF